MRCRFRLLGRDCRGELLGIESGLATVLPDSCDCSNQIPLADVLAAWPDIEDDDHLLDDGEPS